MSKVDNKTKKEKISYKNTQCNGFSCTNTDVKQIHVDAGSFGKIELWLCTSCVRKFR